MAKNVFSVPIFFIVFRETLEAAIIISVLLGFAEQLVHEDSARQTEVLPIVSDEKEGSSPSPERPNEDDAVQRRRLVRRMRIQILVGAAIGFFVALAIGAAFIAVWFTKAANLWAKSEALWEGIFELVAAIMIFIMGVSMLKMDSSKAKWRIKLQRAFDRQRVRGEQQSVHGEERTGKWALFLLPFITVLREGLEAVVFVGGVSLGEPATAIPLATIVGIICGLIIGFIIYEFATRTTLKIFLIVMTNLLLLLGAGLFSRSVYEFEAHAFNKLLGAASDDALGTGPGSYRVQGNIWHLDCCSPTANTGWSVFNSLLGWTNNGSFGTVLSYIFYWLAVIVAVVVMKYKEGRTKLLGHESATGARRRARRAASAATAPIDEKEESGGEISELPK